MPTKSLGYSEQAGIVDRQWRKYRDLKWWEYPNTRIPTREVLGEPLIRELEHPDQEAEICLAALASMFDWSEKADSEFGRLLRKENQACVFSSNTKGEEVVVRIGNARQVYWGLMDGRWSVHPADFLLFYSMEDEYVVIHRIDATLGGYWVNDRFELAVLEKYCQP